MKTYLLGCDWGTSSFRLRLINTTDMQLLGEITSQTEGVAATFSIWKSQIENVGTTKSDFFRKQLQAQIDLLARQLSLKLDRIPVVISGMASSTIGMDEVPYATLPFPVDGSQACTKRLGMTAGFPHDILLISGVRTTHDVMRGEETQLVGLIALLNALHRPVADTILIFPGTHSKHIFIKNQTIVDFQTFMTGEVFELMSQHSILADSIESAELTALSPDDLAAFILGVHDADASILNGLFKVRTNQLFNRLGKRQNGLYLSGLLIGNELKTLLHQEHWQLMLCSGNNLYTLYKAALDGLGLSARTITIPADTVDKAAFAGQVTIFRNQLVTLTEK
ncbi:2-dehydro-3-deoxygalactonokinase [Spirosoma sp. KUDC1026]|uniref:2-dehydro-3-deoxygalactonokinase n=1 Tax=Spirosoma sp. KUDC1026 TaxID=2745947 RepID=UPI00159BDEB2|nr:2-dehydro-3-deoxygalactonokinase [Spirosoma sp. KUDC1026]QKZ14024.1 2-dehydro-3-deoxygalactonokinase [Spirosoma sp. KUDC1026]